MRWSLWLVALLLGPFITGCIGDSGEGLGPGSLPDATLDDALAALDAGSPAANIDVLGTFRDGFGQEAEPWGDYLFVDQGSEVIILDVANPATIEEISRVAFPAVVDVKVSADGNWMFTAEDAEASDQPLAGTGPFVGGIYVTDVSDKTAPMLVSFLPVGVSRGPHMVFYHQMPDGRELVFGAAGDKVAVTEFDRSSGTLREIAAYGTGLLAQDPDPRVIDAYYGARAWVHDMFVMDEPDGSTYLYVAGWDAGLHVVDVSDPESPELLGAWSDFAEDEEGNLHTVVTAWIGDRRVTIGTVEVGFLIVGGVYWALAQDKPVMYVWDTTDPSDIRLLSRWVNPLKATTGRNAFVAGPLPGEEIDSTHNIQVESGRVYLAHYALGVWVLDVSTPTLQAAPEVVGYFFDEQGGEVWDVVLNGGALFSSGDAGVVGTHFVLDTLGPAGVTSRA